VREFGAGPEFQLSDLAGEAGEAAAAG
jgi:hypothetical protein